MNSTDTSLKVKIVLCCLFAPLIDANFSNLLTLLFDAAIGFEPAKITYFGVLGCYTEMWMYVATFLTFTPINFVLNILGYKLSKRGDLTYKLLGAFLMYRIIFAFVGSIFFNIIGGSHPLWFMERKDMFEAESVPVFGNFYVYRWFSFVAGNLLGVFYLCLCYLVVFRYWDKQMRLYFFTYGAAACALGLYLWYFVLGPFLY